MSFYRFVMTSHNPSVEHRRGGQERPHMAMEVREAKGRPEYHGPAAAEEFVSGLLPWARQNALGLPLDAATSGDATGGRPGGSLHDSRRAASSRRAVPLPVEVSPVELEEARG